MMPGAISGGRPLFKPVNATDEQCKTLMVRDGVVREGPNEGTSYMMSAWFPTPDELKALNDGGPVYLIIYGGGHPPVWVLAVENPL
jgi:hypothetical protein